MPTASESRRALILVTGEAVAQVTRLVGSLTGPPAAQRADLLDLVPDLVFYYTEGSAALAADFYDDERDRASARGRFTAEPVIPDRAEKIGRAVAWASRPLFEPADATVIERLAPVVQLETARGYRDTITTNRRRDPEAVGWRRVAAGGCKFCQMLAGRGEVYKAETVRFASHTDCHCTAAPAFAGQDVTEASVEQYVASRSRRTDAQRAALRRYLNENFPDANG